MNIKNIKIEKTSENNGNLLTVYCDSCSDPKASTGAICVFFDDSKEVYINAHQINNVSGDGINNKSIN